MTEAVVWLVLWALFAFVGSPLIYLIGLGAGAGLAIVTDLPGWAVVGVIFGWLGGVAWFVFAAVQTVLQIISVVQLASGG